MQFFREYIHDPEFLLHMRFLGQDIPDRFDTARASGKDIGLHEFRSPRQNDEHRTGSGFCGQEGAERGKQSKGVFIRPFAPQNG